MFEMGSLPGIVDERDAGVLKVVDPSWSTPGSETFERAKPDLRLGLDCQSPLLPHVVSRSRRV